MRHDPVSGPLAGDRYDLDDDFIASDSEVLADAAQAAAIRKAEKKGRR